MKKNIHPKYNKIKATCSCGNIIFIFSTLNKNIIIDVCNLCHPLYTGSKKIVDTGGRVDKFNKKFNLS